MKLISITKSDKAGKKLKAVFEDPTSGRRRTTHFADESKCCLCPGKYTEWGNNPAPLNHDEGAKCCDTCNVHKVIPARVSLIQLTRHLRLSIGPEQI
jgi:hypothetical protein